MDQLEHPERYASPKLTSHAEPGQPISAVGLGWCGIDPRSLTLFRVGLALVALFYFVELLAHSEGLFSNSGVFPWSLAQQHWREVSGFSLPLFFEPLFELKMSQSIFLIAAVFAAVLAFGKMPVRAAAVVWMGVAFAHFRNPIVSNSSDLLLQQGLMWCALLYGCRGARTAATVGVHFAVVFLYVFSVFWKLQSPEWSSQFTALFQTLSAREIASQWAPLILNFPEFLKILTGVTLFAEGVVPLLILIPEKRGIAKLVAVAMLCALHAGIAVLMAIGPFPYLCIALWILFLPPVFWTQAESIILKLARFTDFTKYNFLAKLKNSEPLQKNPNPHLHSHPDLDTTSFFRVFAAGICVLVCSLNIVTFFDKTHVRNTKLFYLEFALGVKQYWKMFSPPPSDSTKYRVGIAFAQGPDKILVESAQDTNETSDRLELDFRLTYIWRTFWDVYWGGNWSEGLQQEWGANLARRFCSMQNPTGQPLVVRIFAVQTPIVFAPSPARPASSRKIGQASCPVQSAKGEE